MTHKSSNETPSLITSMPAIDHCTLRAMLNAQIPGRAIAYIAAFAIFFIFGTSSAHEWDSLNRSLPGDECNVPTHKEPTSWTNSERWAWGEICAGRTVNFRELLSHTFDSNDACLENFDIDDDRKLGSQFLKVVLTYEPFHSAIPDGGIDIVCAYFPDGVELGQARLHRPLRVRSSLVDNTVDMNGVTTSQTVLFDRTRVDGPIRMVSSSFGNGLTLKVSYFENIDLVGAQIVGHLDMSASSFSGAVNLNSISVQGDVFMRLSDFTQDVNLGSAHISGQLSLRGSNFMDRLFLGSIDVGREVFLSGFTQGEILVRKAKFSEVILRSARIGGQFDMTLATFSGPFNMGFSTIGGNLLMREAMFDREADFIFVSVASNLDMSGSTFSTIDLTGADIGVELRFGTDNLDVNWTHNVMDNKTPPAEIQLTLKNTHVGVLHDTKGSWPDKLELDGFSYSSLGGLDTDYGNGPLKRGSDWYATWLLKDSTYSPQPYRHLSNVLFASGYRQMGEEILFAGRERERTKELTYATPRWWLLSALRYTYGYGYGWGRLLPLFWMSLLVAFGVVVLRVCKERDMDDRLLGFWYSLDLFVPIIQLRAKHYQIDLAPPARYYFFIHQLAGYLLVSLVILGMSKLVE